MTAPVNKYRCQEDDCAKNVAATTAEPPRYRKHNNGDGKECDRSRTIIPGWLVRRGPETEDSDVPAEGRDYATCPDCERKPRLDADGLFVRHLRVPNVDAADRVECPKSGQPYATEETCPEDTEASATAAAPATPAAPDSPDSGERPAPSVTKEPTPISTERLEQADQDSKELIKQWAAPAAETGSKAVTPSRESTRTPPDSPQPPVTSPAPAESSAPGSGSKSSGSPSSAAASTTAPSPVMQDWQTQILTGYKAEAAPVREAATASTAPPTKPCNIADDHPPHLWMSSRKRTQCQGKATPAPGSAPTESAPERPGAADAVPASAAASSNSAQPKGERGPEVAPFPAPPPLPDAAPSPDAPSPEEPAAATPDEGPRLCTYCGVDMGGYHSCWPMFKQPGSPFSQPAAVVLDEAAEEVPMTVLAEKVKARMQELFYSYDNRNSSDNRSAQTTLGPSGIGTPCDRRLAMELLGIPAVNPGGDGWAAFKGTAIHAALAEMFLWANAGTGRFAVEVPLKFPSPLVPTGTSDLLDRTLFMVDDHKVQSAYSLNKLRTEGITPTQRVQLHTYGYGMRIMGEQIDNVAIISWPMESSSLDDMYAVVERYNPQIARDALARVDRIATEVETRREAINYGHVRPLEVARTFDVVEDCKFCQWFAPADPEMTRGCPGR